MNTKENLIAIFIFWKISAGIQSLLSFSKEFKHCNSIIFNGKDWIMIDMDSKGFLMRKINFTDGSKLIDSLKKIETVTSVVSVEVQGRHKVMWKPYYIRSCNEVCRYASGVKLGLTFNPRHFYNRLLRFDKRTNYEILSAWRRRDGVLWGRQ